MVAVGPVAAVDHPVFSEEIPQGVQPRPIVRTVFDELALRDHRNLRELDEHAIVLRQPVQVGLVLLERGRLRGDFCIGQVVGDDSQPRHALRDLQQRADQLCVGVGALKDQPRLRKSLDAFDEAGLLQIVRQIAVPYVAITKTKEQRIAVQAVKVATAEDDVIHRFNELNDERRVLSLRDRLFNEILNSIFHNASNLATGVILILAGQAMHAGSFTVGDFALFVYYLEFFSDLTAFSGLLIARYRHCHCTAHLHLLVSCRRHYHSLACTASTAPRT